MSRWGPIFEAAQGCCAASFASTGARRPTCLRKPTTSSTASAWARSVVGAPAIYPSARFASSRSRGRWRSIATLLLLDEPAAGLRHGEKQQLAELLRKLRGEGVAILLVEHDMSFVMGLVDRLVVLDFGTVIARGAPAEVRRDPAVVAAYLGGVQWAPVSRAQAPTRLLWPCGGRPRHIAPRRRWLDRHRDRRKRRGQDDAPQRDHGHRAQLRHYPLRRRIRAALSRRARAAGHVPCPRASRTFRHHERRGQSGARRLPADRGTAAPNHSGGVRDVSAARRTTQADCTHALGW